MVFCLGEIGNGRKLLLSISFTSSLKHEKILAAHKRGGNMDYVFGALKLRFFNLAGGGFGIFSSLLKQGGEISDN